MKRDGFYKDVEHTDDDVNDRNRFFAARPAAVPAERRSLGRLIGDYSRRNEKLLRRRLCRQQREFEVGNSTGGRAVAAAGAVQLDQR